MRQTRNRQNERKITGHENNDRGEKKTKRRKKWKDELESVGEEKNKHTQRQLTHDEIQKKCVIPHLQISHPSEQNGWERACDWLCPNALLIVLLVENVSRFNPRQHGIKERSY